MRCHDLCRIVRSRLRLVMGGVIAALTVFSHGCGTDFGLLFSSPGGPADPLTMADVDLIVKNSAASLSSNTLVIAVTDREGNVLAVFRKPNAPDSVRVLLAERFLDVSANELAISLARTGAFFSNDQAPLSSRTVRFISRKHFPPTFDSSGRAVGVKNTASGALWDIEHTNRGCELTTDYTPGSQISASKSLDRSGPGLGIATFPGGVPLYMKNKLVGGVGVCGVNPDQAEFAAVAGANGFSPIAASPGELFLDGVRLPFVDQTSRPFGFSTGEAVGAYVAIPDLVLPETMVAGPQGSSRTQVPEGWLVGPRGSLELSEVSVRQIIENAVFEANRTRAAIRLPLEARTKMVLAVTSLSGAVLGLYRMPDATVFSIDVAVTKARNVVYFSGRNRTISDLPGVPKGVAVTNRTLRFGSQPFFPPGIDDSLPGPFVSLRLHNQDNACTQGFQPAVPNQSGIIFFPGSAPLYRFGVELIGGFGVSGDGVDQDDIVTAAGLRGFEPVESLRADHVDINGITLPYLKFPRAPDE
ncbi:MAG: heme-binding protein [Planctomycetota bacterium]